MAGAFDTAFGNINAGSEWARRPGVGAVKNY
jgi:hypothetical protein